MIESDRINLAAERRVRIEIAKYRIIDFNDELKYSKVSDFMGVHLQVLQAANLVLKLKNVCRPLPPPKSTIIMTVGPFLIANNQ